MSVLGPLLYNIYVNDLLATFSNYFIKSFADDTVMLMRIHSVVQLPNFSWCVSNILSWFRNNGLLVNHSKTVVMNLFLRRNLLAGVHSIYIDGTQFPILNKVKYLGILYYSRLNFYDQYTAVLSHLR